MLELNSKKKIEVHTFRHGFPVHFVCADRCRFRLADSLAIDFPDGIRRGVVVSSVGALERRDPSPEDPATQEGIFEPLGGYTRDEPRKYFECFVFRMDGLKDCGCCPKVLAFGSELDRCRTVTGAEALEAHQKMIQKYKGLLEGGWFPDPYVEENFEDLG